MCDVFRWPVKTSFPFTTTIRPWELVSPTLVAPYITESLIINTTSPQSGLHTRLVVFPFWHSTLLFRLSEEIATLAWSPPITLCWRLEEPRLLLNSHASGTHEDSLSLSSVLCLAQTLRGRNHEDLSDHPNQQRGRGADPRPRLRPCTALPLGETVSIVEIYRVIMGSMNASY